MGLLPEKLNYGELKLAEIVRLLAICQNKWEGGLLHSALYNHKITAEFYDRCAKSVGLFYKGRPDISEIAEDIFHESLVLIFESAKEFKPNPDWDESEYEKVFVFWMAKFANNLLLKQSKADKSERENYKQYAKHYISDCTPGSSGKYNYKPTYDKAKYDQLWRSLSPMAQEVLLKCAHIGMLEKNGPKHLPPEFRHYICEKYSVTENAINQAKRRALIALLSCKI